MTKHVHGAARRAGALGENTAMPLAARKDANYFRTRLLAWYASNSRILQWRTTRDPFRILLSEVLLQRTQARQVSDNFAEIVDAFPTVHALASAPIAEIEERLRPLGLSKRVKTLRMMAAEILERYDGSTPTNLDELLTLPGVGRYVASATACFSTGTDHAVLDSNVVRLLGRFFGAFSTKARARDDDTMWNLAQTLVPKGRAVDYNRALIDFAAIICRPRGPLCESCPLQSRCVSLAIWHEGTPDPRI